VWTDGSNNPADKGSSAAFGVFFGKNNSTENHGGSCNITKDSSGGEER